MLRGDNCYQFVLHQRVELGGHVEYMAGGHAHSKDVLDNPRNIRACIELMIPVKLFPDLMCLFFKSYTTLCYIGAVTRIQYVGFCLDIAG